MEEGNNTSEKKNLLKMQIIIDPSISGISGDMFIAALVDLMGSKVKTQLATLEQAIIKIDPQFQVDIEESKRGAFKTTQISIKAGDIAELQHSENLRRLMFEILTEIEASPACIDFAKRTLNALLKAEAQVHGELIENIHLHETGSVDTIFDICAAGLLIDALTSKTHLEVYSLPISVGGGFVKAAHGRLPVPSPAATQIAKDHHFLIQGGPTNHELLTPTGAAILAGLRPQFLENLPLMHVTGIGIGGGLKNFIDHPNILRVIQGTKPQKWRAEELIVLETNVDDVTGEVLGFLIEKLMGMGAMDVSILPSVMKKNRPGHLIKVICDETHMDELMTAIIRETGTLGIRVVRCQRIAVNRIKKRFQLEIAEEQIDITAKIAWVGDTIVNVKSEFVDLKQISEQTGLPIKDLQKRVDGAIYEQMWGKTPNDH